MSSDQEYRTAVRIYEQQQTRLHDVHQREERARLLKQELQVRSTDRRRASEPDPASIADGSSSSAPGSSGGFERAEAALRSRIQFDPQLSLERAVGLLLAAFLEDPPAGAATERALAGATGARRRGGGVRRGAQ